MTAVVVMIWRETFGLFVDDGSLALAILAVVALVALALHFAIVGPETGGFLLAIGLVAILAENLTRSARRLKRR